MHDGYSISGDSIHGDKVLGDKVLGDKYVAAPQPDPSPLPPLNPEAAWAAFHALPAAVPPAGSRMALTPNPLLPGAAMSCARWRRWRPPCVTWQAR
jgi:hypothetical protein